MPYIRQFLDLERSCISYVVCCPSSGVSAVIDPGIEIDQYVRMAASEGTRIINIIDTHLHADHVSGARKLADLVGAPVSMGESAKVHFDIERLSEGSVINVGRANLRVISTPGHTVEHISLEYIDKMRGEIAWGVFTGDDLFVGDVGRLDLIGAGTVEQLYESIFQKLLKLGDHVEVYPAHYAGSKCGNAAKMSMKTSSTIGFERITNRVLAAKNLSEFSAMIDNGKSPVPTEFVEIKHLNSGKRKNPLTGI